MDVLTQPQVNVYNEAGRGRKQCPACQKYVGVRNAKCVCGHDFHAERPAETEEAEEINTYEEAGRGRKQCPACEKYVGARNAKCACGHDFANDEVSHSNSAENDRWTPRRDYTLVGDYEARMTAYAPSGACPVKLHGIDVDSMHDWIAGLIVYGKANQIRYTSHALRYFLWTLCDHQYESARFKEAYANCLEALGVAY